MLRSKKKVENHYFNGMHSYNIFAKIEDHTCRNKIKHFISFYTLHLKSIIELNKQKNTKKQSSNKQILEISARIDSKGAMSGSTSLQVIKFSSDERDE